MHERNIGTEHAWPGNRLNWPARPTRKLTLQNSPLQHTWGEHSEHPPIASEDATSQATRSLHNIPWCGLRSRLGVVLLHPPSSDSTRHSNHQPSDGWQVHSGRVDLWQVFSRQIDHWQVHRRPADSLSCSSRCSHLAAGCLHDAASLLRGCTLLLSGCVCLLQLRASPLLSLRIMLLLPPCCD